MTPSDVGRLPPQAIEAEQSVLGALLIDNAAWDRVGDFLQARDFYRASHRLIYQHIEALLQDNKPADAVTVAEALGGALEDAGGAGYLRELALNTLSSANVGQYARLVRDRALRRELVAVCNDAVETLYSPSGGDPTVDVLERLYGLAQRNVARPARSFREIVTGVVEKIDRLYNQPGDGVTGLETGFVDLDRTTAGLQGGDLIVVAGRPSMGKTALAMNIVEWVALKLRKTAAVFSLEMSDAQLVQRMIGSVGHVNQHQLRTGRLEESDWERLVDAVGKLNDASIVIEETYDLQPSTLRAKVRRIAREHPNLALIVVDYLQLMESGADRRVDQVAEITRGLKRIAREFNIPVIALSQLNREVEKRPNKRPTMADLRDSGAIEQDADVILFMYRDEVYDANTLNPGVAEVIIGKQRNGPTGHVYLTFLAKYARFENFAGELHTTQPKPRSRAFEPVRPRADIDG